MNKPTIAQLDYLRKLAAQAGESFSVPETRRQASREIERLKERLALSKDSATDTAAQLRQERHEISTQAQLSGASAASIQPIETRRLSESRDGHSGGAWSNRGLGDYEREISEPQRQLLGRLCKRARINLPDDVDARAARAAIDLLVARNPGRAAADMIRTLTPDHAPMLGALTPLEQLVFDGRFLKRTTAVGVARELDRDVDDIKALEERAGIRARNHLASELLTGRLAPLAENSQAIGLGRTL